MWDIEFNIQVGSVRLRRKIEVRFRKDIYHMFENSALCTAP